MDTAKKRNKAAYDMQYAKENLKRIPLDVRRDFYEKIQTAAEKANESVSGYIKQAITERMERDSTLTEEQEP